MKKIIILFSVLILTSCSGHHPLATKYKPYGLSGGYKEQQIAKNRWVVQYRGNGFTSKDTVYNRAMLRAAELTIELNKDLFAIVYDEDGGTYEKHIRRFEIEIEDFSEYVNTTGLSKQEAAKKMQQFIDRKALTNYFIAKDTLKLFDRYRY